MVQIEKNGMQDIDSNLAARKMLNRWNILGAVIRIDRITAIETQELHE